ncbi:Flp family type IVb pilin [Sneathiella chinensis]|uniref:Flp family type IVb pilin n=1 Tax=Sneathiella chinensis TaxID=349750 RepID=A0ABQ5U188_9PROT|nr:Flp family type IVb pilin [Sneathiella chinensis]GLQ05058.1 hypothetical protein GCM10007924_02790 [Sneathiella chinensis]
MYAPISFLISKCIDFKACDRGATMVEYGLLIAVIAMVVVGAALVLGDSIGTSFCDMATDLDAAANCGG